MKPQPTAINIDEQTLLSAIKIVVDEQNFTRLRKDRMKRKLTKLYRKGELTAEHLEPEWLHRLCAASLMLRDYHWIAWEWRSDWARQLVTMDWVYPRWDGDRSKRLLVLAEQGIGDEIVFASCYKDLARDVNEAWVEVDPRLIGIFSRSFPENLHFVSRFINDDRRIVPRMGDYPKFHEDKGIEAFIMAGNVPKLYRRSRKDFPTNKGFLVPDYEQSAIFSHFIDQYLVDRVGCSWVGRQGEIPKLEEGFSLQYGESDHGNLIVPPIDLMWDLDGVFAFCHALGRVVTTTNACAHISGAVGTATDVIKPPPIFATDEDSFNNRVQAWWPYDKCDWYPSITMYRNFSEWKVKNAIRQGNNRIH